MDKEQKKQFKEIEKNLLVAIKTSAKNYSYKSVSNYCLYKEINGFFFYSVYYTAFIESRMELIVWNYVKTYQADNLFWEIFNMKENCKEKESLRAIGAFAMPSLKMNEHSWDISELADLNEVSNVMLKFVFDIHQNIYKTIEGDVKIFNQYILAQKNFLDEPLIKMIANIEIQNFDVAQEMAQEEIEKGNSGGFQNDDKDIYQYILEYCEHRLNGVNTI